MTLSINFAKMNGLGNAIIVADMRGQKGHVAPAAAVALNAKELPPKFKVWTPRVLAFGAARVNLLCDSKLIQR